MLQCFFWETIFSRNLMRRSACSNQWILGMLSFVDLCNRFHMSQIVKIPTRVTTSSANVLYLILTTVPDFVSFLTVLPGLSEHAVIYFSLPSALPLCLCVTKQLQTTLRVISTQLTRSLRTFPSDIFRNSGILALKITGAYSKIKFLR